MFARIAIRDLVLVAVVVGAWRGLAPLTAAEGALADVLGVLLGLSVALAPVETFPTRRQDPEVRAAPPAGPA